MREYYLDSGSSSIILGIKNLKDIDVIFIPEFICKDLTISLTLSDLRIEYYKIKKNLKTDWYDLKNKLKNKKRNKVLILYVNYFSNINERNNYILLKKNKNISLAEDNSHGFFIDIKKEKLNNIDFVVSSPKKIFNSLYSGGILYKKKNKELNNSYNQLNYVKVKSINVLKKNIKNNFKNNLIFKKLQNFKNKYVKNKKNSHILNKMDRVSEKYLKNINLTKEYNLKKNKILEYNKILNNYNYTVISGHNINNIPWYFTILTKTVNEKKKILKFCSKKRIVNFNWPDLPETNYNIRTKNLFNRIICFPL